MSRPVRAGLVALVVAAAAACGGRDDGADPASCAPSGARLEVEARSVRFDPPCLAAPADIPFTVDLDNRDSLPHNVAIKRGPEAPDDLFVGEVLTSAGRKTYEVPALAAGTYLFYCTVHPQMTGRFVVA